MAKGKLKMDAGAMKEFFLQHVEKIVLGVVLTGLVSRLYARETALAHRRELAASL